MAPHNTRLFCSHARAGQRLSTARSFGAPGSFQLEALLPSGPRWPLCSAGGWGGVSWALPRDRSGIVVPRSSRPTGCHAVTWSCLPAKGLGAPGLAMSPGRSRALQGLAGPAGVSRDLPGEAKLGSGCGGQLGVGRGPSAPGPREPGSFWGRDGWRAAWGAVGCLPTAPAAPRPRVPGCFGVCSQLRRLLGTQAGPCCGQRCLPCPPTSALLGRLASRGSGGWTTFPVIHMAEGQGARI